MESHIIRLIYKFLLLNVLCLFLGTGSCLADESRSELPGKIIWAWERPEDLRWLPSDYGIAHVTYSIKLIGNQAIVRRNLNRFLHRPDMVVVPIVHVDPSFARPPTMNRQQLVTIVQTLLIQAQNSPSQWVQLDFEAVESQKPFLATVIRTARSMLPGEKKLSITALASWCFFDDQWLQDLPADEIVPMVFRMGRDRDRIRHTLGRSGTLPHPRCRSAIGIATDEPLVKVAASRYYFFAPKSMKPDSMVWLDEFLAEVKAK
ncbi:MAG: hypothetical protein QM523_05985 [Candidatus Pacebacteria bacterium]|nr:hypothetical protein [Candidatus Paceibacterota bacterium]